MAQQDWSWSRQEDALPARVHVEAWPDVLIDELGFSSLNSRHEVVPLPQLGPSAMLAWRLLTSALDDCPEGFELDLEAFAHTLGLGPGAGQDSPVVRTLRRLVVFGLAVLTDDMTLAIRRRISPRAVRLTGRIASSRGRRSCRPEFPPRSRLSAHSSGLPYAGEPSVAVVDGRRSA